MSLRFHFSSKRQTVEERNEDRRDRDRDRYRARDNETDTGSQADRRVQGTRHLIQGDKGRWRQGKSFVSQFQTSSSSRCLPAAAAAGGDDDDGRLISDHLDCLDRSGFIGFCVLWK